MSTEEKGKQYNNEELFFFYFCQTNLKRGNNYEYGRER